MIRIVTEEDVKNIAFTKVRQMSKSPEEAIALLRSVSSNSPEIIKLCDSLQAVSDAQGLTINPKDLCVAIDSLSTALQQIDEGAFRHYGVSNDENAPIPGWKCKEWKCYYSGDIVQHLKQIYDGGRALRAKIKSGGSGTITSKTWICDEIIGDKTNKTGRPFGAKGKFETYVQFITSKLDFSGKAEPVYSILPNPNAKTDSDEEDNYSDVTTADNVKLEVKNGGGGSTFGLKFQNGQCCYFTAGEKLIIFGGSEGDNEIPFWVVKDLEGIMQICKPVSGEWDEILANNKRKTRINCKLLV